MTILIAEDIYLLRIFLVRKMSRFMAFGQDFPHAQGFPRMIRGRGETAHT